MRAGVVAAIVAALSGLVGCATIVKGTSQTIAINTPGVPGAECTLASSALGTRIVTTPATLTVGKAADNISVLCKKECYQDGSGVIASHTEAMAAGNIIAGGVIGLGVDAVSGAMNYYNVDNQIAMVPIQGCKSRMAVSQNNL